MTLEPLTELEKRKIIRANILADTLVRLVQWVAFGAIVFALILPLAVAAWQNAGAITAAAVHGARAWRHTATGQGYRAVINLER